MTDFKERRKEKRLRYHWPIWFAEDAGGRLSQGQMVDLCSESASFSCYADNCPYPGQWITARFSVPEYGRDNSFDLSNHVRSGSVCRVDEINAYLCRVAVRFSDRLPFRPGEQDADTAEVEDTSGVLLA